MLRDTLISKIKDYLNEHRTRINIDLGSSFDVYFLAQGEYNINFVIEGSYKKWVFRVNTGSQLQLDNQIRYEYEALEKLEVSTVTPRVFFVDDIKEYFDYGILIMEFLEGNPLVYNKDLSKAAAIFSKIHCLDLDSMDTSNFIVEHGIFKDRILEAERLLKDYLTSPLIDIKQKRFFEAYLDWAKLNQSSEKYFIENKWHVVNNTEVNSNNFIIGDRGNYLIDWEKPVISDPCQDITQFLAPTTTLWKVDYILSEEEIKEFFRVYIHNSGVRAKDIVYRVNLYNPYLYLRALSWCAYAYIEYLNPDKDIKNMDTFNKIKQYLEIDFMKDLLKDYINFKS
jgi:predicted Ser/Thr protein kinase